MTPRQKQILWAMTVAIGLTRIVAAAHSMFDWDEALFAAGVREYDVAQHAPHPPGYPLFIGAAKIFHLFGVDEFRALQLVVVASAILLFPAVTLLAIELGFSFGVAAGAGLLFVFLPNVWIYGGTGFSDIPGNALTLLSCALLLRGRQRASAYVLGAALLGAAAGIRVGSLFIGAVPAVLATWAQLRRRAIGAIVGGAIAGGVVLACAYGGAALATESVEAYRSALDKQQQWVQEVDSYHNPGRPPLRDVAWSFLIRPYDQRQQLTVLLGLSALSIGFALVRRRWAPVLTLATFAPIAVFSVLYLDVGTPSRYAISYLPMYALLAADGLAVVARAPWLHAGLVSVLALAMAVWTAPALRTQHGSDSPPIAALRWVVAHVPPDTTVFVHDAFRPQAQFFLRDYDLRLFQDTAAIPLLERETWVVDLQTAPEARNFNWPHDRLWRIIRQRNFEASVSRYTDLVRFGGGWYGEEGSGPDAYRWMSQEGDVLLPSFPEQGKLTLKLFVPNDSLPSPPTIEVYFNGKLIDRIHADSATLERSWVLPSRAEGGNELTLLTSATASPSRTDTGSTDTREFGLQLKSLAWRPAR